VDSQDSVHISSKSLHFYDRPQGSRKLRLLEILDSRHVNVVRVLSALRTCRLYSPEDTHGADFH